MRTINYKVSYEKMISRLPALFAFLDIDEQGTCKIVSALRSDMADYGKIVANIIYPKDDFNYTCTDETVLSIVSGKEYTYRTLISTYYKAIKDTDWERDEFGIYIEPFLAFMERGIGLKYIGLAQELSDETNCGVLTTVNFPLAPNYVYLGEAKTLYNKMIKKRKQIDFWEKHTSLCLSDKKNYLKAKEEYELTNGDKLIKKLGELIVESEEVAKEYLEYAQDTNLTLDFNINLTNNMKDLGIVTPHIEEWVAGKRYYEGDVVYKVDSNGYGLSWICTLEEDYKTESDTGFKYTEGYYDENTELIYFDNGDEYINGTLPKNWTVQTLNYVERNEISEEEKMYITYNTITIGENNEIEVGNLKNCRNLPTSDNENYGLFLPYGSYIFKYIVEEDNEDITYYIMVEIAENGDVTIEDATKDAPSQGEYLDTGLYWYEIPHGRYTNIQPSTQIISGIANSHLTSLRRFTSYMNRYDEAEYPEGSEDWLWYYRTGTIRNRETKYDDIGNIAIMYGRDNGYADGATTIDTLSNYTKGTILNDDVYQALSVKNKECCKKNSDDNTYTVIKDFITTNIEFDDDGETALNLAVWGDILTNITAHRIEDDDTQIVTLGEGATEVKTYITNSAGYKEGRGEITFEYIMGAHLKAKIDERVIIDDEGEKTSQPWYKRDDDNNYKYYFKDFEADLDGPYGENCGVKYTETYIYYQGKPSRKVLESFIDKSYQTQYEIGDNLSYLVYNSLTESAKNKCSLSDDGEEYVVNESFIGPRELYEGLVISHFMFCNLSNENKLKCYPAEESIWTLVESGKFDDYVSGKFDQDYKPYQVIESFIEDDISTTYEEDSVITRENWNLLTEDNKANCSPTTNVAVIADFNHKITYKSGRITSKLYDELKEQGYASKLGWVLGEPQIIYDFTITVHYSKGDIITYAEYLSFSDENKANCRVKVDIIVTEDFDEITNYEVGDEIDTETLYELVKVEEYKEKITLTTTPPTVITAFSVTTSYAIGDKVEYETYLTLSNKNKSKCSVNWDGYIVNTEFTDGLFLEQEEYISSDVYMKLSDTNQLNCDSMEDIDDLSYYYLRDKMEFSTGNNLRTYTLRLGYINKTANYLVTNFEAPVDITHINIEETPLIRYDYYNGVSFRPSVSNDAYVERGVTQAFEKHIKFSEIKTMEDLENYANGGFFTISKENISLG